MDSEPRSMSNASNSKSDAVFNPPEGLPLSIFENKYSRRKEDGTFQSWEERITEVVDGNLGVLPTGYVDLFEKHQEKTLELAKQGVLPFSGRHLQHGQPGQEHRSGEYLTNCATAMFSFMMFYLLLKNSGVGRSYDSDICFVDWDYMPEIRLVLAGPDNNGDNGHPDYEPWIESVEDAQHKYDSESERVRWFTVADSIEGWAQMVMILETAAFHRNNKEHMFIFDFSKIRPKGSPVKGQQGRPASGPVPLIKAMMDIARIKGSGLKPWKQALFIDHFLASCVLLGGIRRSARMATKSWKDRDVIDFIDIKRGGKLYTANNSITVDAEFWEQARDPRPSHGRRVFEAATAAAYFDQTGEPGFINLDLLEFDSTGSEELNAENYIVNSFKDDEFSTKHPKTQQMIAYMLERAKGRKYPYIVNPCSEIVLSVWGGYCVIGDIAMAHAKDAQELIDAAECLTRFLIRANCQKYLYQTEVLRTNRIGVGITGILEYAYRAHGLTFFDLIKHSPEEVEKGLEIGYDRLLEMDYNALGIDPELVCFWQLIRDMKNTVDWEAKRYSEHIRNNFPEFAGISTPHTNTCIKPSGTISKVMGPLTEGAHLPAYGYYLRWIQESSNNVEELERYRQHGYPIKDISHQYPNTSIIGFPTCLPIADLMGDDLVTAEDVSWDDQIRWLQLLERFWLGERGNQISYTLKYDPEKVTFEDFREKLLEHQPTVRCCAVMPQTDTSAYAYVPEQKISREDYELLVLEIVPIGSESYDSATLECEGAACPIDPDLN